MSEIGEKILAALDRRRWSQAELARVSGLHPTTLSRAISGTKGGRLYGDQVLDLANALGVSLDYLLRPEVSDPNQVGPEPPLTDDQRIILRLAAALGTDTAIQRLAVSPKVRYGRDLAGEA